MRVDDFLNDGFICITANAQLHEALIKELTKNKVADLFRVDNHLTGSSGIRALIADETENDITISVERNYTFSTKEEAAVFLADQAKKMSQEDTFLALKPFGILTI